MDNKKLIAALKKWLQDNSAADLAARLGYRSSETVYQWIKRGRIPSWVAVRVADVVTKG